MDNHNAHPTAQIKTVITVKTEDAATTMIHFKNPTTTDILNITIKAISEAWATHSSMG
jgi:hypothetical protein